MNKALRVSSLTTFGIDDAINQHAALLEEHELKLDSLSSKVMEMNDELKNKLELNIVTVNQLDQLTERVVQINEANGWEIKSPAEIPEKIALVHSELSEALEEYRSGNDCSLTFYKTDSNGNKKPEGFPSELADVIIRVLHIAAFYEIDLTQVINEKLDYNATRGFRHGGKLA